MAARPFLIANIAPRPVERSRWLLIALLLALASTLVPALFPSGSVAARLHGSAFDPTTSTVTLRARQDSVIALTSPAADPDGSGPAAGGKMMPPSLPAPAAALLSPHFAARKAAAFAAPAPRALLSWRGGLALARAPPLMA